jgi:hypothetical protein
MSAPSRLPTNRDRPVPWAYFVAIAVVLALAGGLLSYTVSQPSNAGGSSPPLAPWGPSWGTPVNASGSAPPGCPLATGHYCYSIEIAGGGEFEISGIQFGLRNGTDQPIPWPASPANDTVSLECPNVTGRCGQYDTAAATWTIYGSTPGILIGGETVVIYTAGTGPAYGLLGDSLALYDASEGLTNGMDSNPFP